MQVPGIMGLAELLRSPSNSFAQELYDGRVVVSFLRIKELSVVFGGLRALSRVAKVIPSGGIDGLIAPNGAGAKFVRARDAPAIRGNARPPAPSRSCSKVDPRCL